MAPRAKRHQVGMFERQFRRGLQALLVVDFAGRGREFRMEAVGILAHGMAGKVGEADTLPE